MESVRFGVIGVKGIGKSHLDAIHKTEGAELVAVCDIDREAAESCAGENQVEWYEDHNELYRQDDLDAVAICTPHYLHAPMAIEAMEAGIHVFLEKPLAISVNETDEMNRLAKETGKKLGVSHQHRASPNIRTAKRLISEGKLGEITRACWISGGLRTQAYYDSGEWRGTWEQEGGGVLINQAVHYLDALHYLLGNVKEIRGKIRRISHQTEVEDLASAVIEFKNGASCIFQAGLVNAPSLQRVEICGDLGTLIFEDGLQLGTPEVGVRQFIQTGPTSGSPECEWQKVPLDEGETGHVAMVGDFVRAIVEDREPLASGKDAAHAVEMVNAIILSSVKGKAVTLPLEREEYAEVLTGLRGGVITI